MVERLDMLVFLGNGYLGKWLLFIWGRIEEIIIVYYIVKSGIVKFVFRG